MVRSATSSRRFPTSRSSSRSTSRRSSFALAAVALVGCGRLGFDDQPRQDATDATDPTDAAVDATPDARPCLAPYQVMGTGCYRFQIGGGQNDWAAHEALCEADGGHLAVIDDAAEMTLLANELVTLTALSANVGFSDRRTEGTYLTVTGQPAFLSWSGAEPTGGTAESCGGLNASPAGMVDRACLMDIDYICEIDGVAADPTAY